MQGSELPQRDMLKLQDGSCQVSGCGVEQQGQLLVGGLPPGGRAWGEGRGSHEEEEAEI